MTPKIDTRRLKRLPDGDFTMHRAGELPTDRGMCHTCGHAACPLRPKFDLHANVTVNSCNLYVPSIGFSVLAGLDLPSFNTIRIGLAWPKRLRAGDELCLVNTKDNVVARRMLVERMCTGILDEVIRDHSRSNHAILATRPDDPIKEMHRIMRNSYGSNFASPNRKATAIYLES